MTEESSDSVSVQVCTRLPSYVVVSRVYDFALRVKQSGKSDLALLEVLVRRRHEGLLGTNDGREGVARSGFLMGLDRSGRTRMGKLAAVAGLREAIISYID